MEFFSPFITEEIFLNLVAHAGGSLGLPRGAQTGLPYSHLLTHGGKGDSGPNSRWLSEAHGMKAMGEGGGGGRGVVEC